MKMYLCNLLGVLALKEFKLEDPTVGTMEILIYTSLRTKTLEHGFLTFCTRNLSGGTWKAILVSDLRVYGYLHKNG